MPDWKKSMQQTFEYYTVDPATWKDLKPLNNVKSCTISWDSEADTLGSATLDIGDSIGEAYIRVYLITIQNGVKEKHVLGTFLAQTTPSAFDGRTKQVSVDAYTPLIELKEKYPPIGYFIEEGANIMDVAYSLTRDNLRAPVVKPSCDETLYYDFVAETDDKMLSFIQDLMNNAKYTYMLDETGRILFSPKQDLAALQPVITFDDGNSSILYPDIDFDEDLYGIPNVVEVIYSSGGTPFYARVENNDPNSPISTVSRGREIMHRITDPNLIGNPTNDRIIEYAKMSLKELSKIECTISYSHGYYPVRVGDCVRLNYEKAGIIGVKAKVVSQSIECVPGCPVTEKAVYTKVLDFDISVRG